MVAGVEIRKGTLADVEALREFNAAIASETEGKSLNGDTLRRGVLRAVQLEPEVVYFVAERKGGEAELPHQLVGCLMLTREWSDWRDGWIVWVQSVYVMPAFRGRGIFRQLLETATEHARSSPDVVGMRLYVEVENEAAQAVYTKSDFVDARYKVFEKFF